MAPDRRIGSAGYFWMVFTQSRIQRLSHAVKALKLETAFAPHQFENGRHRQRVMARELREEVEAAAPTAFARTPCSSDRSSPCA